MQCKINQLNSTRLVKAPELRKKMLNTLQIEGFTYSEETSNIIGSRSVWIRRSSCISEDDKTQESS